jgi:hypothetical protein
MRVDYPVTVNGKAIVISQECDSDQAVFKFLHHMDELYGNMVCERNGKTSDKVKFNVRKDKEENEYFEVVCVDHTQPDLHYAKRSFGVNKGKDKSLFPKNKTAEGTWKPWTKYNKDTGKEE